LERNLCFTAEIYLFLSPNYLRARSVDSGEICTVVGGKLNFIAQVQTFEEFSVKKFRGQKHAKFGTISDGFKLRRQISPEEMKIFKIGQLLDLPQFR